MGSFAKTIALPRRCLNSARPAWRPTPPVVIDATHGAAHSVQAGTFLDRNLFDLRDFSGFLRCRRSRYVRLDAALCGLGDALTIDDSTVAAALAARIARHHGHEVSLFVNGYNIESRTPYFFTQLDVGLDTTRLPSVVFAGIRYPLRTHGDKWAFRKAAKSRLLELAGESDRQKLARDIAALLGARDGVVPPHLQPITPAELADLAKIGVDLQNHGWQHTTVGALDRDRYAENIRAGRQWLEAITHTPCTCFAVPNGDGLPPWRESMHYDTWLLLNRSHRRGRVSSGVFNRGSMGMPDEATEHNRFPL